MNKKEQYEVLLITTAEQFIFKDAAFKVLCILIFHISKGRKWKRFTFKLLCLL